MDGWMRRKQVEKIRKVEDWLSKTSTHEHQAKWKLFEMPIGYGLPCNGKAPLNCCILLVAINEILYEKKWMKESLKWQIKNRNIHKKRKGNEYNARTSR